MRFDIGTLGAAMQGQRDYQDWIQAKQAKDQQMQFEALRIKAMQEEMARQAQDQQRQKDVARGYMGMMSQGPQPPAPGQPSQPMMNPAASRPLPPGQAGPVIPPYKSMNGAQPAPQGMPQIPEPPKYDWDTAVKKIEAQGIKDPETILAIMEKNQARLDVEAKARLAQAKEQFNEQFRLAQLSQGERRLDNQERNTTSLIAKRSRTGSGGGAGGGSAALGGDDAIETAAWDRIITGHEPPARGGMYGKTMARIGKIAKENGMTTQELLSASADVKTKLAAKKNFEVRAQNMKRAENQLEAEIPVFEQAVKDVNTYQTPAFAKLALAVRRQRGDPLITKMDQAAEVIFREFEGLVTGNPGTLNVQDVQNAHQDYMNAQTPQEAAAAIAGMRRIIKNAQAAMNKTRSEIMGDINNEVNPKKGGAGNAGTMPSEIGDLLKKYGGK